MTATNIEQDTQVSRAQEGPQPHLLMDMQSPFNAHSVVTLNCDGGFPFASRKCLLQLQSLQDMPGFHTSVPIPCTASGTEQVLPDS